MPVDCGVSARTVRKAEVAVLGTAFAIGICSTVECLAARVNLIDGAAAAAAAADVVPPMALCHDEPEPSDEV